MRAVPRYWAYAALLALVAVFFLAPTWGWRSHLRTGDQVHHAREPQQRGEKARLVEGSAPVVGTEQEKARSGASQQPHDVAHELPTGSGFRAWVVHNEKFLVALGTIVIAAFTVVLGIATGFLFLATRSLVQGADATAKAQLRAYVHYDGCRWLSYRDANGKVFWRIRPRWRNGGTTPTRRLRVYVHYELIDHQLPGIYSFTEDPKIVPAPATIPPHGSIESAHCDVTGDDLVAVSKGRKFLYVWGVARYRDVLPDTPEHITKFCIHAASVTNDPRAYWHAETNPVEILFLTYDRHNCADEDCNRA